MRFFFAHFCLEERVFRVYPLVGCWVLVMLLMVCVKANKLLNESRFFVIIFFALEVGV